ncbi:nucleotidyltransferase domain-containing protein [Dictyobacter kobayashii]|uniref:Polymerase beta nucleotidyltransferase domain-containing protein n=1 Tax=Dictyobacter kobayashii TaxID=2014872 RepID=A0A402AW75_9CHLR|nr:nucleotidyltransferase domain-containing protein [Dictyobacter kobayashii]GCE23324.1 hypothetical protein KDK_71240 [Dictyobacter kobayashii]
MQDEVLLRYIIDQIKDIKGINAIVLGGSYASNSQRPDSDIDIGIYYSEANPLDIRTIRLVAQTLNDFADPTVTKPGGWGTWVNGEPG